MKSMFLGLGLILSVSFLDVRQAWTIDLPQSQTSDLQVAKAAAKKKDFTKVIDLLSPKVEKLNREGLLLLGNAYGATGKRESAIKTFTACLALDPTDYEAKSLIGAEQVASGKDKEALATLKEALDINPMHEPAYETLIRYYEKKNNKYELRLLYEDMLENVGETIEIVTSLCKLTTNDRLYDLAFKHCQRGIALDPKVPENYVYMGIASRETGNTDKANAILKKAANDFPKSEVAQIAYAQHLEDQKNYIGSYNFYKRALEANKDSVQALVGLGNSGFEIQKYTESLEAFTKACKLDRKTLPAFRKAANSLRTMKVQDWLKKFEVGVDSCGG
jgi:tetratricopeptide (TPR) repeat protein